MQMDLDRVTKRYAGITAVKQLSCSVNAGEIFAMLGPNGAGKSSTIRMLIGLTQPDEGAITFTVKGRQKSRLASSDFGYLPEERGLFQEQSLLNILLYLGQLKGMRRSDARQQAMDWLGKLDLEDRHKEPLKTLSKGNQQKVQLISAVLHRPQVVLLDEPFSGLDPVNQEKVIDFLSELRASGATIVLSAHQMSLVEKLADRFLLLNQGQKQLYGSLADIRRSAALKESVLLAFTQAVDASEFSRLPGVSRVSQIAADQLELQLDAEDSLPALLQQVMQGHPIRDLQTRKPGLHDIYLASVQQGERL